MTQVTFDKSTKFFRSFTAATMPVVPVDEVGADDIDQLISFYAADFDDGGRLCRCRKFLNVEDDEAGGVNLVFDDRYTYSASGNLETRALIRADGNEVRWFFDSSIEAGRWRDVSLAHDQLTELESRVMPDAWATGLRGSEFAVSSVRSYLTSAEQVLRTSTQDPNATVLMLIPCSEVEWLQLHPFGDLIGSLDDIETVLMPHMLECDLPFVCANLSELSDAFAEGGNIFATHEIRALAAHSVNVKDDETIAIGVIAMVACRDWPVAVGEHVMSLLKRIAVFVELMIEFGQRDSPIPRASDASNSQD